MEAMSLNEIREKYLAFFESKGHLRMPSFSLVPRNDPSILLINAGMTPLKPYFTGAETPPSLRVTTCQKCIRTPDIERVGKTSRHGTYFEMLGNFSFGDYFKKEVIPWAWEFCTEVLKLPEDKLYVTVYQDDDEAFDIWHQDVGLAKERIFRMGKEDNFWEHGTGPCGPCSEIFFDRGEDKGCGSETCTVGCDCDRFVEFWNLVFTQFNREEDGSYTPLAKKNIDTGGGLERFACIMQNVDNLFEVDTIRAILDEVCRLTGRVYGKNEQDDTAIRVMTDHIRSTTMMISDGILPSNEGRGYVLRRLLRRAARFGRLMGLTEPFLHELSGLVIRESGDAYPELRERQEHIRKIIYTEETRFAETVQQGMSLLEDYIAQARDAGSSQLSGSDVFRLHDTYGFPLDLTREIAAEQNLTIDEDGFHSEMNRQKNMARQALKDKGGSAWGGQALPDTIDRSKATAFTGYDVLADESEIIAILSGSEGGDGLVELDQAEAGQAVTIITAKTPFYASSGGQTGDIGVIRTDNALISVEDTTKTAENIWLHAAVVESGTVRKGDSVKLEVDIRSRLDTARNHTVTHILHKALREVLGDHVAQAGSAVSPERLRFDFNHYQAVTAQERDQIERRVNEIILQNMPVKTDVMTIDEARGSGAMALFDEKYGDTVRVVSVGDFSRELCGGTHLSKSTEACQFRLLSESGVAAGVRRIEGVTGPQAYEISRNDNMTVHEAASLLKCSPDDLASKLAGLLDKAKQLEKALAAEQAKQTADAAGDLAGKAEDVGAGMKLVAARIQVQDMDKLRQAADNVRDSIGSGVVVLAAENDGKVNWVVMATKDAVGRGLHAGQLVKEAAMITGGGGGGRPDMAQAGGKDAAKIDEALAKVKSIVIEKLG